MIDNQTGRIIKPINVESDLGFVLGTGSGDVGTNVLYGNVNKWAKYKFVRRPLVDYSNQLNAAGTDWRRTQQEGGAATWWQAEDGKCGLAYDVYEALGDAFTSSTLAAPQNFLKWLRLEQTPWTYARPRGKDYYEWFRVFDMIQYDHAAARPFGELGATDIWLTLLNDQYSGSFDWDIPTPSDYALTLTDFKIHDTPIANNYYLGVLLWKRNGEFHFMTSPSPIAANNQSISIPFSIGQSSDMIGAWNMVPFISSRAYALGDGAQEGYYTSLFGIGNSEVVLHKPGTIVDFIVWAYWDRYHSTVTYELEVTNHSNSARTIMNVCVEIMSTTSGSQDPSTGQQEALLNLGSIAVPANGLVSRIGSIPIANYSSSKIYWVKGLADDFGAAVYEQIEEDPNVMPD